MMKASQRSQLSAYDETQLGALKLQVVMKSPESPSMPLNFRKAQTQQELTSFR
jgi:hypothetical protein